MQSVVRTALRYVRYGALRACIRTDLQVALRTLRSLRALRRARNQPLFIAVAVTLVPPDVRT